MLLPPTAKGLPGTMDIEACEKNDDASKAGKNIHTHTHTHTHTTHTRKLRSILQLNRRVELVHVNVHPHAAAV